MPEKITKEVARPHGATDAAQSGFFRKHALIIYAAILLLIIPSVIIGNTFFVIKRFTSNIDEQLRRQALIISELVNATTIQTSRDLSSLPEKLKRVYEGPEEVRSIEVMVPQGDDFKVIASPVISHVNTTIESGSRSIAWEVWHSDRGIAWLARPSKNEISKNPGLSGTRYWNVLFPLHAEDGTKVGLLNLRMSLAYVDDITIKTLIVSSVILLIVVVIIILLLLVNTRLFEFAILFRKLEEVDKMKDEFISMASHELRTPITAINGYVSMFLEGSFGLLSDAGKKGMVIIEASIKRLANLVEDLLNVSRIEQNRLQLTVEPVPLGEVIQQTIDELKMSAGGKRLELIFAPEGELPVVSADRDKLRQILVNIIGNAIKYTEKGSVTVSVAYEEEFVKVKIKDTGIGMSAKDREQLFGKFYRVKSEKTKNITGTGLGLWITKQLIKLMGGEIYVDSLEGVGTEMSFTLKKTRVKKT